MSDRPVSAPAVTQADPLERIAFGAFEILPGSRTLLRRGALAPIGGRAFDLLLTLARAPGLVVVKEDLMRGVWPLMIVEEANLRAQLRYLRRALGDEAWRVKTVPGRGYLLNLHEAPGERRERLVGPPPDGVAGAPPVVISASPTGAEALRHLWAATAEPGRWATVRITGERGDDLATLAAQLQTVAGAAVLNLDPIGLRDEVADDRRSARDGVALAMVMVWSAPSP